jgi:WD40 repeat protein
MRDKLFFSLCLLLLSLSMASAQTSPELVLEVTIGSPLQGQLLWLDDERLLVGTSAETRLYEGTELLYTIPDGGIFTLMDGEILLDGQIWDSATGELLGETDVVKSWENEDDSLQANLLEDGSVEIRVADAISILPLPEDYSFSRIFFSPDGIRSAIVFRHNVGDYYEEILQLWNIATLEKIADLPNSQYLELVGEILFFQEGRGLVVSYTTNSVYGGSFAETAIWDAATGQRLNEDNFGFTVRLSPNRELVSLTSSFEIQFWGMRQIGSLSNSSPCEACIYSDAAFSADGHFFAASHGVGFTVWDISRLDEGILPTEASLAIQGENADYAFLPHILFSPDGQSLLRWDDSIGIEVWDAATGEEVAQIRIETWMMQLGFSPDGRTLNVRTNGPSLVFDTETWQESSRFTTGSLNPAWTEIAYWQEGHLILENTTGEMSQSIPIIEDNRGAVVGMNSHEEWVLFRGTNQVYQLRDDSLIASFSKDSWLSLSETSPYFLESRFTENDEATVSIIAFQAGEIQEIERLELGNRFIGEMLVSHDARTVSILNGACGDGGGGSQTVWHRETEGEYPRMFLGGTCGPYAHIFSPDGNMLITAWDSLIMGLDLRQETIMVGENAIYEPNAWYRDDRFIRITNLSLSSDSRYLAYRGEFCQRDENDDCQLSDLIAVAAINTSPATPEEFATLAFTIPDATNAVFSPDSQFILTNQSLWSIAGRDIMSLPNQAAAFDPAGRWLVTYSEEELLLWDWAQVQSGNAEPLHRLPVEGITKLEFNADGSFLYAQRAGDVLRLRVQTVQS